MKRIAGARSGMATLGCTAQQRNPTLLLGIALELH
jgi:hypothetical protein